MTRNKFTLFKDNRSTVKNKILGLTRLNLLAVSADLDGLALVPGVVEMLYLVKAELFAANPVDFENTAQRSGAEAGRKDPRDLRTITSRLRGKASKSTELSCARMNNLNPLVTELPWLIVAMALFKRGIYVIYLLQLKISTYIFLAKQWSKTQKLAPKSTQ